MFRSIQNFIGSLKGYSGCGICGDTWNWKKAHYIANDGAFPFCEECWEKYHNLDKGCGKGQILMDAADDLAVIWMNQTSFSHRCATEESANKMLRHLKEEIVISSS